jgi:hypothetical protein
LLVNAITSQYATCVGSRAILPRVVPLKKWVCQSLDFAIIATDLVMYQWTVPTRKRAITVVSQVIWRVIASTAQSAMDVASPDILHGTVHVG